MLSELMLDPLFPIIFLVFLILFLISYSLIFFSAMYRIFVLNLPPFRSVAERVFDEKYRLSALYYEREKRKEQITNDE